MSGVFGSDVFLIFTNSWGSLAAQCIDKFTECVFLLVSELQTDWNEEKNSLNNQLRKKRRHAEFCWGTTLTPPTVLSAEGPVLIELNASQTSSYRWKREGRKSEIKTAKTDQPIREKRRSLWSKAGLPSSYWLTTQFFFSRFQSNNHTINNKFTVIRNAFEITSCSDNQKSFQREAKVSRRLTFQKPTSSFSFFKLLPQLS